MRLLKLSDFVAVVAFVITAAEFTYWLGRRSRQAIEAANDVLASLWVIAMGVGETHHYYAIVELFDAILPTNHLQASSVLMVAAPVAPPAPPRHIKGRPAPSQPAKSQPIKK